MTIKFLDLYNDVASQPWSMFDSGAENKEDFEPALVSSINKAIIDIWYSYPFSFRLKKYIFTTLPNINTYNLPNGNILNESSIQDNLFAVLLDKKHLEYNTDPTDYAQTGTPEKFDIDEDNIILSPTPNKRYKITMKYLSLSIGFDKEDNEIFYLENPTDYIDIPQKYEEIGIGATNGANNTFAQLGVKVKDVIVENISLPDAVEKAIDERSSMGVIGNMNTYTSYKAANALSDAAKNQSGVAGMGVGLGAGVGFGQIMGNAMSNASTAKSANVICPHCNAQVPEGKFCPECGKPLVVEKAKCIKCGATINKGAKFCPECGAKQEISKVTCPKCHAQVDENVKFCPECGEKLN